MVGNILLGGFSHAFTGSFPASPVHKIPEWLLLTGKTPKARWCFPQPELWPSSVSSTTLKDPVGPLWSVRPKQQPSIKATLCHPPLAFCSVSHPGWSQEVASPHCESQCRIKPWLLEILYISNPLFVPLTQKSSCSPEKLIWVSIAFYKNERVSLGGLFCGWFSLIPCPTAVLMTPHHDPLARGSGMAIPGLLGSIGCFLYHFSFLYFQMPWNTLQNFLQTLEKKVCTELLSKNGWKIFNKRERSIFPII